MNIIHLAGLLLAALPAAAQEAPQPASDAVQTGLRVSSDSAYQGYTLVAPLRSKKTYLLDMQGKVAHTWTSDFTPGHSAYLLEDGSLLRCGRVDNERFNGGGQGGRIQRFSWDGELLWDYQLSTDTNLLHHDIEPLPNGHVLAIAWEFKDADELLRKGRKFDAISEEGLWPDAVFELVPRPTEEDLGAADVVWEWHAWDHLIQDENEQAADFGSIAEHPGRIDVNAGLRTGELSAEELEQQAELEARMRALGYVDDGGDDADAGQGQHGGARGRRDGGDWLHTNSIDYDAKHDLILLSSRVMSEVWIIDHGTTTEEARGAKGDLLWRYGNPSVAEGEGEQTLFGQHDARFVSGGAGVRIQVFNNGEGRAFEGEPYSTVDVIDVELGGAGKLVSSLGAAKGDLHFYSSFISGAQALPGGSTLICSGAEGRVLEVDASGKVVWDWQNDLPDAEGGASPPGGRGPMGPGGPRGDRPDGPPDGRPGGRPGRGAGRGPGGGPGHGGAAGFFRATRYGLADPAVARLAKVESATD